MSTETVITRYLQTAYGDQHLAALLAHAEDGKLSYLSCCCLAHFPTAKHAAKGEVVNDIHHYLTIEHKSPGPSGSDHADHADSAYCVLGCDDAERRANLIPLIRAEMLRRESLATHNVTANTSREKSVSELSI